MTTFVITVDFKSLRVRSDRTPAVITRERSDALAIGEMSVATW